MVRLYPFTLLLPITIPALAQQPDRLAPRRAVMTITLPDSVFAPSSFPSGRLVCTGPGVPITQVTRELPLLPFLAIQEQLRQVAGVQATPYSGAPGAQVAVRIRGAASLSGNAQPLYVVDGIPVFQNTFQASLKDNSLNFTPAETLELDNNPLLSIPTEDIQTVEVLKGAWETAHYGSQGANGVIRITTKRGQTGPLRVRYAGYGGVQKARYRYDLLNAQEYANLVNEAALNSNQPARFSPQQVAAFGQGTDWQAELMRTAAVQEHHLSLDGGSRSTHYYVGADYLNQKSIVLNSRLNRYSGRAAVEHQLGQHLTLQAAVGLSETQQRMPGADAAASALLYAPTIPVRNSDGSYANNGSYSINPVQWAQESYMAPQQRRLLAQLGARYEFLPGLALDLRGNLERATLDNVTYRPSFSNSPGGQSGDNTATYKQWVLNPALRYIGNFGEGRHAVEASVEAVRQRRTFENEFRSYTPGQPSTGLFSMSGSTFEANVAAYQLTSAYTFAGRYQVQGRLRRDASSAFSADDRWQWLPSARLPGMWAKRLFYKAQPTSAGWMLGLAGVARRMRVTSGVILFALSCPMAI